MQSDYLTDVVLHTIMLVGSPLVLGFMLYKHHTASRWIQWVFVLLAIVGEAWGVIGVLRLGFPAHFARSTRGTFYHYETLLGGFALGLLGSLFLSPEFWKIGRGSKWSNQGLQPTADRPENHENEIKK